jgi:endonuclease/exonuclease/phosphatase family metal-dependent hydrolase
VHTSKFVIGLFAGLAALSGCRTGRNYDRADGPRFASSPAPEPAAWRPAATSLPADADDRRPDTLRIVSFNVKFAQQIDSAIRILRTDTALRAADVVLLQEMDEAGTQRIAQAMAMSYTYYPAAHLFEQQRDFGNAVLSRWPIESDAKIVLPHVSRFQRTQRIATAATIRVRQSRVRVYSAHLGTIADVFPGERRHQLRAILADAARFPHVIIGGDMNNHGVGRVASASGYEWPTEHGPSTVKLWRWDHIFVRGLTVPATDATGTVLDVGRASDHRPVWTTVILSNQDSTGRT